MVQIVHLNAKYYFFEDSSFYQGFWEAPLLLVLNFSAKESFV